MEKVVPRGLWLYEKKKFSLRDYFLDISQSIMISDQPFAPAPHTRQAQLVTNKVRVGIQETVAKELGVDT